MPSQNSGIQLVYQVCPIILTGGIAAQIPGGMLPILSLTNSAGGVNLAGSVLPFSIDNLDDAYGTFTVLPGGTLVSQEVAHYPFANQSVAANATIRDPLVISVIMDTPMKGPNAWATKQAVMSQLKATLDNHNNAGGTYTVMTPAFMYEGLIMLALTDTPRATGNNTIPQGAWKFDFQKPLVTLSDAASAQNQLMGKLTNAVPTSPAQTGVNPGTTGGDAPGAVQPSNLTTTYNVQSGGGFNGFNLSGANIQPSLGLPPASSPQYVEGSGSVGFAPTLQGF